MIKRYRAVGDGKFQEQELRWSRGHVILVRCTLQLDCKAILGVGRGFARVLAL